MTPLAHEIMRARLDDDSSRLITLDGAAALAQQFPDPFVLLRDVHFFEVSQVLELLETMSGKAIAQTTETMAFLPARRTWIEWGVQDHSRMAFLLEQEEGADFASVTSLVKLPDGRIIYRGQGMCLPLRGSADLAAHAVYVTPGSWASGRVDGLPGPTAYIAILYGLLAMINTPKLIGQRTHQPHRGLERRLLNRRGPAAGQFPLRAWKEIVLEVSPPKIAGGDPVEAHFTGRRALHFCRAYLRMQFGKLVVVSAHWRGDPALGIERSRYTVKPPRPGASQTAA